MPRIARIASGGLIYHVLNRGNGRRMIFHKDADAQAFLDLLAETKRLIPMRILSYCVMGNHWHTMLWPYEDGDLSRFMGRLTTTHVRRYYLHYHDDAGGHLYQGRFKNFPVDCDQSLAIVLRYVEANPLRAGLVERAEDWRFSSLWHFARGLRDPLVDDWPIERPADWIEWVNQPQGDKELTRLRTSLVRGRPYGRENWVTRMCRELGLEFTTRNRGRPRREVSGVKPGLNLDEVGNQECPL